MLPWPTPSLRGRYGAVAHSRERSTARRHSASSEARSPSQLAASAKTGRVYQLTGKVQPGSIRGDGTTHTFRVRDREGRVSVPVSYTGALPDPFRDGREIIVDVRKHGATFVGQRDTLVTKCPSKFTAEKKTS